MKNKISDINVLENVIFKELRELHLSFNQISDIKVLEKIKFDKLEKLYLIDNQIDNEDENNLLIIDNIQSKNIDIEIELMHN